MKVAHFAEYVPHGAGMYHTVHDLILAERGVGIDARFIDWGLRKEGAQFYSRVGLVDGEVETVGFEFAEQADVIVRHSALPARFNNDKKPVVFMLHGRPEYSFELEYREKSKVLNEILLTSTKPMYKAFATFWQEHVPVWKRCMDKTKAEFVYIPPVVDLHQFTPDGKRFSFDKFAGTPNIVIADMWREDVSPYQTVQAVCHWIETCCPEARVHLFGVAKSKNTAISNLIGPLQRRNLIGGAYPIILNIEEVYRSADILVTPHNIATRVVRESLASGCPIVAGIGSQYTPYTASAHDHQGLSEQLSKCWADVQKDYPGMRRKARATAEKEFNFKDTGDAALQLFNKLLGREANASTTMQSHTPKIYVSTPSVVRDLKDEKFDTLPIGIAYNEYMEMLPHDNDYACFIDHDAMWTTDDWFTQVNEIVAKYPDMGLFAAVTNRIGNKEQLVEGVDSHDHDIKHHRKIGESIQSQGRDKVTDITKAHRLSGVVMLIKKSAWKAVGGFKTDSFLGVDNDIHTRMSIANIKVGRMDGLYVYHWYRYDGSAYKPLLVVGK